MIEPLKRNDEQLKDLKETEKKGSDGTFIMTANFEGNNVIVKELTILNGEEEKKNMSKCREIYLMSDIGENPYIVKFHGWTEQDNYIRLILEDLRGGEVFEYITGGNLTVKQKVKILLDSAQGLEHIHRKEYIHRDIKASNIALDKPITGDSLDFTAKIFDFGVSRESDIQGTSTHTAGTMKYCAPEQGDGQVYTQKVDIYAFAIFAFELFSGNIAFSDVKTKKLNDTMLKRKVQQGLRPDKYVKLNDDTPKEIAEFINKNWDANPDNRMSSEELVKSLKEIYDSLN